MIFLAKVFNCYSSEFVVVHAEYALPEFPANDHGYHRILSSAGLGRTNWFADHDLINIHGELYNFEFDSNLIISVKQKLNRTPKVLDFVLKH